ncbi:long chain acyl-CoA synthetase 2 [Cajanus cajan]|uniref:Long-chain-fatty-acid--CoA ligase n=1 Tax=Cajanus cajan TaxID=3821 RepID=A0A151TG56_CAJCA|nr:long chain acyl-CoA synthetase 2 [Cajanus cajan]KYP66032.1 Fatty acyl-CoA synthetase B [Cajanus cajan]
MAGVYTVKVEEARPATPEKPSAGPAYRCIFAKDALTNLPSLFESPWDFFRDTKTRCPSNPMLGRRKKTGSKVDPYEWITYQEAYDAAIQIGSAMKSRGVNPGDRCGIYGSNCPEWIIAMEACNGYAVTYVPLYDTLGPNAVEFIINHAEVSIAFVQDNKIPSVLSCLDRCSNLKTIVSFGNVSSSQKKEAEELGASCFTWGEFLQLGNTDFDVPLKKKTNICTIMYTSGTTGEPKGVIIKNEAFMTQVLSIDQILYITDVVGTEDDVYFSFLPLAHIYDQIMETYCIYKGSSIGFWQGDVRFLMEDIQALKPTLFCGVPRVYDRVYAGISSQISSGGALRSTLFQYAYNYKLGYLEKGLPQDKAAPLFDRLVFDKIRQALGGRVRLLLSGAAPLPRQVEEFLRVTFGANMSQGYGLTESCGGCFTAISNVFSMMGTIGVPMTTIEARLESVPEMGYDALSSEARGEICLRGNTLFSGYHKRQDLTEEVLVDGWFHTGDIGEWQPNGSMKIIDRKKNIFKLSQGEYVAVENIENKYLQCPLVTSIWVYGNSFEPFLVAVVVPERNALEDWAMKHNSNVDFKSLCGNLKARKYILDELNRTGQKHQLRGFEMLKAVHLEPIPFDMERDLVTPTFKLKRSQLLKHYKDYIDQLYKEAKAQKV